MESEKVTEEELKKIYHKSPISKNSRKSYYICQSCQNKFVSCKDLERHLLKIKGCLFLNNTCETLKKLMTKLITDLDFSIQSLRIDMNSIDVLNRSRRIKAIKHTFIKIERLYENQSHLYDKNDALVLREFIDEYKDDIIELAKTHYALISDITLADI